MSAAIPTEPGNPFDRKDISKYFNKPLIWSILQDKGGSGKTTMAINITRCLQNFGLNVVLVDSDQQGSSRDWSESNGGDFFPVLGLDRPTIAESIKAISEKINVIVIDGAPGINSMSGATIRCSDIILIPVQPSPYDVWASMPLVQSIKDRQELMNGHPKAAFVISRAIKNSKLSREVTESLAEYGMPVLDSYTTQMVVYPTSAHNGRTVFEEPGAVAAKIEIIKIVTETFERFIKWH